MPRITRVVPVVAASLTLGLALPAIASAERFVSPSGGGSACTAEAPCGTFDAAYRAAAPGEVVQVAAGSYGSQQIPAGVAKSAPPIVFQPAGGAVTLGSLNVFGGQVDVRDIATGFVDVERGASDVTVRNGSGTGVFVGGGSRNVSFLGGSYGGGAPNVSPVKVQGSPAPDGVTFDGVVFHDAVRTIDGSHLECLYAADVQNFTVRNSQFRNCAVMDLFFTKLSGVDPRGITVENNFFDRTGSHGGSLSKGFYAIKFNEVIGTVADMVIRYNSFYDPIAFTGSFSNARVVANVGPQTACAAGVTFRYNVWTSKTCGATDKQAASGFADPGNYDFHLAAGSAALGAGDPSEAPAVDIDGDRRPSATRPDAGADQRTGAPAPPPVVPGGGGTPSGTPPGGGTPPAGGGSAGCSCASAAGGASGGASTIQETDLTTGIGYLSSSEDVTPAAAAGAQQCPSRLRAAASQRIRFTDVVAQHGRRLRRHRIGGTVACRTAGVVRVEAQRRAGRTWHTVTRRRARVSKTGRFAISVTLRRGKRYRLVARYAPTAQAKPLAGRTGSRVLRG